MTTRDCAAICSGTLSETAEDLVHGFSQAIQKRGLPRALLTDNGAAMVSDEFTEGLLTSRHRSREDAALQSLIKTESRRDYGRPWKDA